MTIQSSIAISDISFAGIFAHSYQYSAYCIFSNITNSSNNPPTISLTRVTLDPKTILRNLISAGLPSGSLLIIDSFEIVWDQSVLSVYAQVYINSVLYNVWSTESSTVMCAPGYTSWPTLQLSNINVANSAVNTTLYPFPTYPALLLASSVGISVTNVTWTSSGFSLQAAPDNSCNFPDLPQSNYLDFLSLPDITLSSIRLSNFLYYNDVLFYLVGGSVSLINLEVSNLTFGNINFDNGLVTVYPSSLQVIDSQFILNGLLKVNEDIDPPHEYSIVDVTWNSATSQQLANYSALSNRFQNVNFISNQIRPISLTFAAFSDLSTSVPFQTEGIIVSIDNCTFVNNNGSLVETNFGGAILALAMTLVSEGSGAEVNYYSSINNTVIISDSKFDNNTGNVNGGAIALMFVFIPDNKHSFESHKLCN